MIVYLLPILAVCIGFAIAYFLKRSQLTSIKLLLAFSGAYLLSLTVFEFFPEVYTHDNKQVGLFIMIGILLQILLEFLCPASLIVLLNSSLNIFSFNINSVLILLFIFYEIKQPIISLLQTSN